MYSNAKENTAQLIVFRNALLDAYAPVETDTFLSSGLNLVNSLNLQIFFASLWPYISLHLRDTLKMHRYALIICKSYEIFNFFFKKYKIMSIHPV